MSRTFRHLASGVCCLLMACAAPQVQHYPPAAAEKAALPEKSWLPEGKPKAVIVALHGFNDYSKAFAGAGKFFRTHGIAVIAYDQRGFGSTPDVGIWPGRENLISDARRHVLQAKHRWPRVPVYLLGESMGGAVAIVALADPAFPKVQGVILAAPALWGDGTMNPLNRALLWLLAHSVPSGKLSGKELHILASDNIPMLRRLAADPLVIKATRVDAIYGLMQLMDDAYDNVPDVKTPVLLLYGAHDEIIPRAAINACRPRFTAPMAYRYYPHGYHMLLRDLEGKRVMTDILKWIQR
ncbi:MAG: lysophospholipase [Pseudomonadota bacterium]|nr:lysophospholipase [Pseudomonadota bacterium]MDE3038628.1 lysophospholipase [Pseudomonadota bacterium]